MYNKNTGKREQEHVENIIHKCLCSQQHRSQLTPIDSLSICALKQLSSQPHGVYFANCSSRSIMQEAALVRALGTSVLCASSPLRHRSPHSPGRVRRTETEKASEKEAVWLRTEQNREKYSARSIFKLGSDVERGSLKMTSILCSGCIF